MEEKSKFYTISEVCDIIRKKGFKDFQSHNLRYLEKVMQGIFEIRRDEYSNRVFQRSDIEKLQTILSLREQGLNYNAIKTILMHKEEKNKEEEEPDFIVKTYEVENDEDKQEDIVENIDETNNSMILSNNNIDKFRMIMTNIVNQSIQNTVSPQLDSITKEILELKIQNIDLKKALEKQQEIHFRELDAKLLNWRKEQQQKKSMPWILRLFS